MLQVEWSGVVAEWCWWRRIFLHENTIKLINLHNLTLGKGYRTVFKDIEEWSLKDTQRIQENVKSYMVVLRIQKSLQGSLRI